MELLDSIAVGFATALTLKNLAFCFIGAFVGANDMRPPVPSVSSHCGTVVLMVSILVLVAVYIRRSGTEELV